MIKSLFEVLEDRSVTDFTVDGKCSNCGACCANLLHLTENEKAVIYRYIQKHQIREQKHRYPTSDNPVDMTCPFRSDSERKCLIYSVRPLICRRFQCNRTPTQVIAGGEFFHRTQKLVDMREEFFGGGK